MPGHQHPDRRKVNGVPPFTPPEPHYAAPTVFGSGHDTPQGFPALRIRPDPSLEGRLGLLRLFFRNCVPALERGDATLQRRVARNDRSPKGTRPEKRRPTDPRRTEPGSAPGSDSPGGRVPLHPPRGAVPRSSYPPGRVSSPVNFLMKPDLSAPSRKTTSRVSSPPRVPSTSGISRRSMAKATL